MSRLRELLDELTVRASLSWPTRQLPSPPALRQVALDGDRTALASAAPSRPLGPREILAARALLEGDRGREHQVEPEPIDVEVLLALPAREAFQLRQLFAVRPSLARGSEDAWLRVDRAILARQGLEAASVVATRLGSALFVRDASLVGSMVAATRTPEERIPAQAWLLRHADLAAAWAVRAALGVSDRDAGASLLAFLFFEGRAEIVEAALARAEAEELRGILQRPYVPGLAYAPSTFSALPELVTKTGPALPVEVARIASALAPVALGESPLVTVLREEIPPRALSDFALALFSAWREERKPTLAWVPARAAELGDGRLARALARAHRALLSKRDPAALELLDALSRSPSELAQLELGRVADGDHAAARARARKLLLPLAEAQGVSVDRLIERTVPSLELDAAGARPIEDGRGWSLLVTNSLSVAVRDPSGGIVTQLSRGKAGAAQKSAAGELEAEVRAVASRAAKRLERAMCDARPLTPEVVQPMIAHPVLLRVVQALVWQDASGARFRIAEDRTAATIDDDARPLPIGPLRVAHPVAMPPEERSAWRSLLESYELVPPFAQLDRRVHVLTDSERALEELRSRFFATRVHTLLARGYRLDWGADELVKTLPDGLTIHIALSPRFDPRVSAREQGELDAAATVRRGHDHESVALGALDPAVASELWELMPPRP
jgi:hypothetical protein